MFSSFAVFAAKDVERIKVTGSHIKRLDQEGTSPVTVIDRDQLNLSGTASLADVIRNLGFATSGVSRKYSLADGNGLAQISLRGLPVGYMVVLLNGKRIANTIDLNLIPKSAIERVEIVKDGASAIYGSDAIGGVMNFITKRGDVGGQFSAGGYLPEPFVLPKKYLKYQGWRSGRWADVPQYQDKIFGLKGGESLWADLSYGWSGDTHQSLLGVSFQRNQSLKMQQRPHTMATDADLDSFSTYGSPGSYKLTGGALQPMPGCPENRTDKEAGLCKFNYFEVMEHRPTVNTLGVFFNTDLDLDDDNELFLQVVYSLENSTGILAPAPDALVKEKFTTVLGQTNEKNVATWNSWTQALETESGLGLSQLDAFRYRMVDEKGAGQRKQDVNKHSYIFQAELTHYLSDDWTLNASINSSGFLQGMKGHNYALIPQLLELDESGKAKFNPFRAKDSKSDIAYATYNPTTEVVHSMTYFETSVDGELLSLGKLGTLSSALGGRGGYEHWSAEFDEKTLDTENNVNNQWGGGSGESGSGGRYWVTGYTEFVLPLRFSSSNLLELQLAGSGDYYQYAGWDMNPKAAFKWMPGNIFQLRGSAGTGFKAPEIKYVLKNFRVIDHPYGSDYRKCPENIKDWKGCSEAGGIPGGQYEFVYLGSQNLKPEKSQFYNIGLGIEPVKNFYFGLDYFVTQVEDRILQPEIDDITKIARYNKDVFETTFKNEHSTKIEDDGDVMRALEAKYYNFGSVRTRGLEANVNMQLPVLTSSTLFLGAQGVYFIETFVKKPHIDKKFRSKLGHWAFPYYALQSQLGMKYKSGVQWFLTGQVKSRFNQAKESPEAPDSALGKVVKTFKKRVLKKKDIKKGPKSEVCAAYKDASEGAVCQVARHFNFDLGIFLPLSALNGNPNTSLLLKVENILNTVPPEHRFANGNQQTSINDISANGFIPVGMYSGVDGRAFSLQVNHKF